jgi:putative colanic acid biosynthesis acetyltransferase WcaF
MNQLEMNETPIELARFPRHAFVRGRSLLVQALWRLVGPILACPFTSPAGVRCLLLRMFGAEIGTGVLIKGGVRVRYPWRLVIGRDSWIGEECWIDNWELVTIGSSVCISQSAYICTGNHDWSDPTFAIMPKSVVIGDGVWIGARSVIGPGVSMGPGAIAGIGSVVTHSVPAWEIHAGNPAHCVKMRQLRAACCPNS